MTATAQEAPTPAARARPLWLRLVIWALIVVVVGAAANLLGWDVRSWFSQVWDTMTDISLGYLVAGLSLQTVQTTATAVAWLWILRYAYPDAEIPFKPVLASYAAGVALNGWLPANIGTFVTLIMFVAIIPSATVAGSFAAYLVQKIFFTLVGAFVYLYLFLSVGGSVNISFGNISTHPVVTVLIVAGALFLLALLVRVFWRQVKKLWKQAKQGGVILAHPTEYLKWAFLPSFLSWLCKLAVIGICLAAFAIPVTFDSIMWIVGSGSLANVASFTPGTSVPIHIPVTTPVAASIGRRRPGATAPVPVP